MGALADFRRRVRAEHSVAFELHADVAAALEQAVTAPRSHPDPAALALDMLMVQSYKAHLSVMILAEHGHIEDAATITRRLLELAAQALWIGGDEEDSVRQQRAGRYLADLWDHLPEQGRQHLPPRVRGQWQSIFNKYGSALSPKRRRWGPDFKQMFEYAGQVDTYEEDYTFLSGIAHGSSEDQILLYSSPRVTVRPTVAVGILLVFASRYYLVVAEQFNRTFCLISQDVFEALTKRAVTWMKDADEDEIHP